TCALGYNSLRFDDEFTRNGFTGPLNWYRCFDRNWELTATPPAATIEVPALFIGGTADATLAYTPRHRAGEVVGGEYREVMIEGAGHWLTEERPRDVTRVLLEFLADLPSTDPIVEQRIRPETR
ncbi:MAG: alpha/beta fold hydrolase, partial [Mycobacterium sp.]